MTCMMAGADKIKTSTGKTKVNATIPYGIIMARAIKLFEIQTGRRVGLKAGEQVIELPNFDLSSSVHSKLIAFLYLSRRHTQLGRCEELDLSGALLSGRGVSEPGLLQNWC